MPVVRRIARVGASQRGFTLIELVAALSIGMIILLAAWTILDRSVSAADEVSDRVNTTQRARNAMEEVTGLLRSQVCLPADVTDTGLDDSKTALISAQNDEVTFYVDHGGENPLPDRRRLSYSGGTLTEQMWRPTGTAPNWVYPSTPTRTRTLGTGLAPAEVSGQPQPVFRYFAFGDGTAPTPTLALTTPLNTLDLSRTVKVDVTFAAKPERNRHDAVQATLRAAVFVRGARQSDFSTNPPEYGGPPCM